ncbi:mechanosensitive ion channel [Xylella fastidiosa subsp. fastidiosa]|jgi:miniconductance mechanosensitive channel|nr:mechanosensitive ion channel family protein [Xylella fastidiosa]ADN62494.1 MscS mechanosensitive ion channel [Xylella fastidiosa subsp. fastidiosa GB514]KAF0571121.1 small mechanosensitive ion channel protein MscS [Xylella fastidiosa subsp. fastidiosa Mus-1]ACB93137.1 MscS Mechanosensitive ion channel [Xylella fastidiosa M23]EGO81577.1 Small-conductance mechanosensitive channel MscS [Xylella fastidiosa EB92.1]KGM20351.1 mechanosensitive ion channel protein MscS [Xylella fastidiosa]
MLYIEGGCDFGVMMFNASIAITWTHLHDVLAPYPWVYRVLATIMLLLAAWFANWVTKRVLLRGVQRVLRSSVLAGEEGGYGMRLGVIPRLANVVPALVLSLGVAAVPDVPLVVVAVVRNVCTAFIVLTVALALARLMDLANQVYERRPDAQHKPIKSYVQLLKIVLGLFTAVLMISVLIDKSPLILLSGLGAMMAVLILVFQDTLLSLVASVTINSNDMVRVGDWIEMPQQGADGDVIDIALHTIKVQNWDKTITAIPIKRLISDSFKNWRGMHESGGRRIKRSLFLDQCSVRFLDDSEIARMREFSILRDYIDAKCESLAEWNVALSSQGVASVNARRITNLGTFRAYVEHYLRASPHVHQEMTLLVRQLQPTDLGLPLEIYCFTNNTDWVAYEQIQSDIFDHLLALLPHFGLRVFQSSSDTMLMETAQRLSAISAALTGRAH